MNKSVWPERFSWVEQDKMPCQETVSLNLISISATYPYDFAGLTFSASGCIHCGCFCAKCSLRWSRMTVVVILAFRIFSHWQGPFLSISHEHAFAENWFTRANRLTHGCMAVNSAGAFTFHKSWCNHVIASWMMGQITHLPSPPQIHCSSVTGRQTSEVFYTFTVQMFWPAMTSRNCSETDTTFGRTGKLNGIEWNWKISQQLCRHMQTTPRSEITAHGLGQFHQQKRFQRAMPALQPCRTQ